jgi:hypothetical protein
MANLLADRNEDDEPVVWFSIPLSGATVERLMNLSNICHAEPTKIAASLLHDILADDEASNLPAAVAAGDITYN